MLATNATMIPKERVATLRFPRHAVSLSEEERREVLRRVHEAALLGNTEHGKCRILFEDEEGLKAVETTIWTYDAHSIVLKYGMTIPLYRVVGVEIP